MKIGAVGAELFHIDGHTYRYEEAHSLLLLLLLPDAELSLITESFGLLNDLLLPFLSIPDASCPISDLHLPNVLFDVILPSVLGSSL